MSKLRENYNNVCNDYLKAFCEKHGFDYEDAKESWAAGYVGGVCNLGEWFVNFDDIRTDLDMHAPKDEYFKYYDYDMESHDLGFKRINYDSWLLGAPRLSHEQIKLIREAKNRIYEAKAEFERVLNEEQDKLNGF